MTYLVTKLIKPKSCHICAYYNSAQPTTGTGSIVDIGDFQMRL